jgi:transcriptional/translational regulatory protein YebC/TACO1
MFVDVLTDNSNRAAADIRKIVNKAGMKIGSPGSVAFNFDRLGVCRVLGENIEDADELLMAAIDAGAEECELDPLDDRVYRIITAMDSLQNTRDALKAAGIKIESAELEMVPKTLADVSDCDADLNLAAIDKLEGCDDVDAVFCNMSLADDDD